MWRGETVAPASIYTPPSSPVHHCPSLPSPKWRPTSACSTAGRSPPERPRRWRHLLSEPTPPSSKQLPPRPPPPSRRRRLCLLRPRSSSYRRRCPLRPYQITCASRPCQPGAVMSLARSPVRDHPDVRGLARPHAAQHRTVFGLSRWH